MTTLDFVAPHMPAPLPAPPGDRPRVPFRTAAGADPAAVRRTPAPATSRQDAGAAPAAAPGVEAAARPVTPRQPLLPAVLCGALAAGLAFAVLAQALAAGPWAMIGLPDVVEAAAWLGLAVGLGWGGLAGALAVLYTTGERQDPALARLPDPEVARDAPPRGRAAQAASATAKAA